MAQLDLEGRSLTDEERKKYDTLKFGVDYADAHCENLRRRLEALRRHYAATLDSQRAARIELDTFRRQLIRDGVATKELTP